MMTFTINNINSFLSQPLVEVVKEPTVTLQIIPDQSVTNGTNLNKITSGLHALYEPFFDRFSLDGVKLIYKRKNIFRYGILISKTKISFHLIIPQSGQNFIMQRIYDSWPNCTVLVSKDDYLDNFNDKILEYKIEQEKDSFRSMVCDYKMNAPIPSILAVSKDIQENNEYGCLELVLEPIDDDWKITSKDKTKKYRNGQLIELGKSSTSLIIVDYLAKALDSAFKFFDVLFEVKTDQKQIDKPVSKPLKPSTNQKINYEGFEGQVRILSQSNDEIRRKQIADGLFLALQDLSDDNQLTVTKKVDHSKEPLIKFNFKQQEKSIKPKPRLLPTRKNVYSTKEIGMFMQMPEANWQKDYPVVESIASKEFDLPSKIFEPGITIGDTRYKGKTKIANWNRKDFDVACLPKAIFGVMRSGKTKYMTRYAIEALERDEAVFLLDGIKNCEFSDEVLTYLSPTFPKEKIKILDFGRLDYVISMFYTEVNLDGLSTIEKLKMSNLISNQLVNFLDSLVEDDGQKLSPKMRRYLTSACLLGFSQQDTSLMDVFNILTDYDIRHKFIDLSGLKPSNKIIQDLLELDDKNGDTKTSLITGIIDRLDLLVGDFMLRNIFTGKPNKEIDFKKWTDEGCLVICRMPQDELNDGTISTLQTFLLSKLWLAMRMRAKSKAPYRIANCLIDEIHRSKTAIKILDTIRESAKFGLNYFFSAHQPSDFKSVLGTLKSSGCSFVLLNTTKENFNHFKEELRSYSIEELLDTKKYHAKCIVNYDKVYSIFEAKLPTPFDLIREPVDRQYLYDECQMQYGIEIIE